MEISKSPKVVEIKFQKTRTPLQNRPDVKIKTKIQAKVGHSDSIPTSNDAKDKVLSQYSYTATTTNTSTANVPTVNLRMKDLMMKKVVRKKKTQKKAFSLADFLKFIDGQKQMKVDPVFQIQDFRVGFQISVT